MTSDETRMYTVITDWSTPHTQHVSLNNKQTSRISCRCRVNEVVERQNLSCSPRNLLGQNHVYNEPVVLLKGTQSALRPRSFGHQFSHFEKSLPQPEIEVHLEIRFNCRCVVPDFQSLTEPVLSVFLFML